MQKKLADAAGRTKEATAVESPAGAAPASSSEGGTGEADHCNAELQARVKKLGSQLRGLKSLDDDTKELLYPAEGVFDNAVAALEAKRGGV